jgi:hypothetical protein
VVDYVSNNLNNETDIYSAEFVWPCKDKSFLVHHLIRLMSYGPPWAHYLGGYQDRLLGRPLGLPDLRCTAPASVKHKDYRGEVLRWEAVHVPHCIEDS